MTKLKMLPSQTEAEDVVMGILIRDASCLDDVGEMINERTLYSTANQQLYKIIRKMKEDDEHIDLVTVSSNLTDRDKNYGLDSYYLACLNKDLCSPQNVVFYAQKVYESYLMRNLIIQTKKLETEAYDYNSTDVYQTLNNANEMITELISVQPSKKFDINSELVEAVISMQNSGENLIKTGYSAIDDLSGGMTRGEVTIIGGRPGHGKTTSMLNILSNCIHQGLKVMLVNREMTNIEMLKKLIALESGKVSYGVIRRGVYDTVTLAEVESARKKIEELYSSDRFIMFDNLRDFTSASSQIKKFKPDIVFDDYIQLIKPNEKIDQRRLQLEEIVHGYKWVAKTNNCVVVLLSQLNRMLETRAGYPKLSDLAESGSIEQVAENVFFVYYDYKIKLENSKLGKNVIELVASKVRYGNSGVAKLGYNGDKVKIYNSIEEMEDAK